MPTTYLMVFHDWPEKTRHLTFEEKGRLIEALVLYSRGDFDCCDEVLQGKEALVFPVLTVEVDRAEQHYLEVSQKRQEAGRKGGLATQKAKANNPKQYQTNQAIGSKSSKTKECKCEGDGEGDGNCNGNGNGKYDGNGDDEGNDYDDGNSFSKNSKKCVCINNEGNDKNTHIHKDLVVIGKPSHDEVKECMLAKINELGIFLNGDIDEQVEKFFNHNADKTRWIKEQWQEWVEAWINNPKFPKYTPRSYEERMMLQNSYR